MQEKQEEKTRKKAKNNHERRKDSLKTPKITPNYQKLFMGRSKRRGGIAGGKTIPAQGGG